MANIVFLHSLSHAEEALWLARFKLLLPNETVLPIEQINEEQAREIEIAIVANPNPELLARFENLIWIQSLWAGVEGLVASFNALQGERAQQMKRVKLVRLIDPQLAQTMGQAALTWSLYLYRNIPEYAQQQRDKVWQPLPYEPIENTRVSVLGAGELGVVACKVLTEQGFSVNCWSRSEKDIAGVRHFSGEQALVSMLEQTDILLCLLPLTDQTKGLLNKQMLSNLPAGGKLINFARGPIVNHPELIELLDVGHLSFAVLDVFEREPLPVDDTLWQHPKVAILPHISATTSLQSAAQVVANNIEQYRVTGDLPVSVDFTQGY